LNGNNTQAFSYDNLNRLSGFANGSGSTQQSYGIDPWGNLTQSGTLTFSASFDGNNHINGLGYDAAGNLIAPNNGALPGSYIYDAESKLIDVNNGGATYTYDA
jgi:hypothetical protein